MTGTREKHRWSESAFSILLIATAASMGLGAIWIQSASALLNSTPAVDAPVGETVLTRIPACYVPEGIAVNNATSKVYVACSVGNMVDVISEKNFTVIKTIPVRNAIGIAINTLTDMVYVTQNGGVTVINGTVDQPVATIGVPCSKGVDVNPVTNEIYVADDCEFKVYVISGSHNNVTSTINVQPGPITQTPIQAPESIAVNPVTNTIYATESSQFVIAVINGGNKTVGHFIGFGAYFCAVGIGARANPITNRIYFSVVQSGLVVIDGSTNTINATIGVGREACGVSVDTGRNIISVANQQDNTISVIDGSSNAVIGTVPNIAVGTPNYPTFNGPVGLTVDAARNLVYATDVANSSVTVLTFVPLVTTALFTSTGVSIPIGGSVSSGASVYDTAKEVGVVSGKVPTGNATYKFYTNGNCTGPASTSQTVVLTSTGSVPNSASTGPLGAGSYSFNATYSGDSNYVGSTSACEPFRASNISKIVTVVFDASTNAPWSGSEVAGASAYDTANVTGVSGTTPSGTVTYAFFTDSDCSGSPFWTSSVTLTASGSVPHSAIQRHMGAIMYSFDATYSGDSKYFGSQSACEPFTVLSSPVGGANLPIDKLALLSPFIIPAFLIVGATTIGVFYVRRTKHMEEKQ